MKKQRSLKIRNLSGGRLVSLLAALGLMFSASVSAQSALTDIKYSTGVGGAVDVILELSGPVPEPQVFTTDNPARIAVDLEGTTNDFSRRSLAIGSGATRSVTAVESRGRTRVVVDLFRSASYETAVEGNRIVLTIRGGAGSALADAATSNRPRRDFSSSAGSSADVDITNVDFRRGLGGEGRIIIDFNDSGSNIDMSRQGDTITANIYNAALPASLEQRLDVLDFATPVATVDTFTDGNRVKLQIRVNGEFEHLAYQTGNQYVIEVQEYVEPIPTPEEQVLEPPEYTGSKVTFNFQQIPVRAALLVIADISQLNIVVSDSVDGNITLRLQEVPWDQALDIILQSKSLDKRQTGDVIWIAPAQEISAREQAQLAALREKRRLEPLQSTFIQVNYAQAADLAALIQSGAADGDPDDDEGASGLLSPRGSVTIDARTNVLLVTDTADRLEDIRELVTLLDRPVRQVQIESRIVVANNDFNEELGARFGFTGAREDSDGNIISTSGSAEALDRLNNVALTNRGTNQPPGAGSANTNGSGLPVLSPAPVPNGIAVPLLTERLNVNLPAAANAGRFGWAILTADYLLDLELSALEQEGRGEVISSPRLITANQEEAFIRQGVELPFQQASSSGATNISFKPAVLELRVTPLITPDDRVILNLAVNQDTIGQLVPVEGGGQVPSVDTRAIQTEVLIDSGQTVVLGGIYEQTKRYDSNKVPVLGDLPGLGNLFRQRTETDNKSELLIFVTPTILSESFGVN